MRTLVAATVTTDDLTQYFKGERSDGDEWRTAVHDNGSVIARCDTYSVELNPKGVMYHVEISASEDSSDGDSKVTDNPVEFIVDFLGTGTSGDDYFKKRSSLRPEELRDVLHRLSDGIDTGSVGPRKLSRVLRRAMLMTDVEAIRRVLSAALKFSETREDFEVKDLAKLKADMTEKGWKVSVDQDDRDLPVLHVDVGGVYRAQVSVDHVTWDYSFEVNGTEAIESGVTDDPIVAFRNFYRNEDVMEAKGAQKERKKQKTAPQVSEEGTVPASSAKQRGKAAPAAE